MKIQRFVLAALVCATTVGCVSRSAYQEKIDELRSAKAQLRQVGDLAEKYGTELAQLEADKSALEQENSLLRANSDEASQRIADLMRKLEDMDSAAPQIPGVQGMAGNGVYTYRVENDFLFDPGKSDVKASGKQTINSVAELLRQHDLKIEVAGHTDSDPVSKTIAKYPHGNIELGAQRAISVYDALRAAGIPAERMRISSYGEHEPVEVGNKARNRRVEIRVLLTEPTVVR